MMNSMKGCCPITACVTTQLAVARMLSVVSRFFLALIFVLAGIGKLTGYAETQGFMQSMGVPSAVLPLVIVLELTGGILLFIGYRARLVALLLAGFSIIAAVIFHSHFADPMQMIMFLKNVAIAGGLLQIILHGAGPCAMDNCCKKNAEMDCSKPAMSCCDKKAE